MTLYSIFLSDKEQIKLKIFVNQKESSKFDLIKFSKENFYTYRTLLNYSKEIKEELKIIKNNFSLSIEELLDLVTIEEYLRYIYSNNFCCQMIYSSLIYPELKMNNFLERMGVSARTAKRDIDMLNQSLSKYNLYFSSKNFALEGQEQIIQLLFYNLIKGPYFEIDPFFSENHLAEINSIFKKVFIKRNQDVSTSYYRHLLLFFKINLLRLKQNYRFEKTNRIPPAHYEIDILKEWYITHFHMNSEEAKINAIYIDYFYSYSPYTLIGNNFITIDEMCDVTEIKFDNLILMKKTMLNTNKLPSNNPYLEVRLLSNLLFTLIYGVPFMCEDNFQLTKTIIAKEKENILNLYNVLFGNDFKIDSKSKDELLKYIQIYKNSFVMKVAKIKIYIAYESFFSGSGLFANLCQNIAEFYSLKSLKLPVTEKVMLLYEDDSPFIQELKQNKNIILYQWIYELSYGENIHRILDLLYRTSSSFYSLLQTRIQE